jgi:excisionase family DNA binding protein
MYQFIIFRHFYMALNTLNKGGPTNNHQCQCSSPFFTVEELSRYLNVKPSKIRAMVFRRELPFLKFGRLVRFSRQEIDAWTKQRVSH